ncbi:hypothetical protein Nans01_12370 [Nocardiopsis ansamitocini]|uniref:SurA-like protein n=2 Tax=Nocardiopsis ansamitocini TaxID=1670832 RepID=A0A9W6P495_9ACTN|nr:hypothetical protein Nans01_12370 [Nocardiopsis ansamitocini]
MLTGCGVSQAGSAVVVGGESLGHEQVRSEVERIESASGRQLSPQQRSDAATRVLSSYITVTTLDQIAKEEGIAITRADTDEVLDRLGGRESPQFQGLTDAEVDDQVRVALIGDRLASEADPADLAEIEDKLRTDTRAYLTEQAEYNGLSGAELEEQVETAMAQLESSVPAEAANLYPQERFRSHLAAADIEVNPRYGVFDPAGLTIDPRGSLLSAPAEPALALPQGQQPMGG